MLCLVCGRIVRSVFVVSFVVGRVLLFARCGCCVCVVVCCLVFDRCLDVARYTTIVVRCMLIVVCCSSCFMFLLFSFFAWYRLCIGVFRGLCCLVVTCLIIGLCCFLCAV